MGSIKKEYELCISALEKGHNEAINLKNDLNKAVGYSTTIVNLKKRNDELKNKYEYKSLFRIYTKDYLLKEHPAYMNLTK